MTKEIEIDVTETAEVVEQMSQEIGNVDALISTVAMMSMRYISDYMMGEDERGLESAVGILVALRYFMDSVDDVEVH